MKLLGLDHADIRVPAISAVEAFYDAVFPALGLSRKTESHVGIDGEWYDVDASHPRNAVEYHTPLEAGARGWFVGIIEDSPMIATGTRIAFALDREDALADAEALIFRAGGRIVEMSHDENYPALFFEDPVGTRLEICVRKIHP